jgi:3-deoxy-D-manno-octulosonic-acid transferase
MNNFWYYFYNSILIVKFRIALAILSLFNLKIRTSLSERKNLFEELSANMAKLDKSKKNIWFHSSSVGEFEQAKPIIERLKESAEYNIIVSFLSPSGFHSAKRYEFADVITYLPFDSRKRVERFLSIINPIVFIIMRYDFWPNMIWEPGKRDIPIFLVDATMNSSSKRNLPLVKNFHKHLFNHFTKILTISDIDRNRFLKFGLTDNRVITVGDTRYDRVYSNSQNASTKKILDDKIIKDKIVLVAGSTWREDEEEFLPAVLKLHKHVDNLLTIVVPHEPTLPTIELIEYELKYDVSTIRFSLLNQYNNEQIIIIDSVGILLTLYSHADFAFVGGGFKSNIHNVLEPAVYGIPVIFGPKHSNSQEAENLVNIGGGFEVQNKKQLYKLMRRMTLDDNFRLTSGNAAKNFVQSNIGATEKILSSLQVYLEKD